MNANTGWIAGTGNNIYKTTNGGLIFDSVFVLGDFKDVHFKDANTGLIVGSGGSVYKTTNSGNSWYKIYLQPNNYGDFRKISVINNQFCFTVEDAKRVYRSTNYGDTWDSIGYVTDANHPYSCRFSSLQTGWVVGTYGEIFKSINGGATWNFQYVNTSNIGWLRSLWFQNDSTGWVVGGNTKLLFTSTGGATFVNNQGAEIADNYKLYQNYPNPFNSQTIIEYEIILSAFVDITVFDISGRKVKTLLNDKIISGKHFVNFKAQGLSSGIYLVKMTINDKIQKVIKIMLVK
ncbi:MAG: YCF48-related protein [Ignavibacteria bacterium]